MTKIANNDENPTSAALGRTGKRRRATRVASIPRRPRVEASRRDLKQLWGAAAGRCSYPSCGEKLIAPAVGEDDRVVLGEHAHIIPHSDRGPRGSERETMAPARRHTYENLILLCEKHHKIVDGQPAAHDLETLRRFKRDHELRCASPFEPLPGLTLVEELSRANVTETLHATMFAVDRMPKCVYSAPTTAWEESSVKQSYFEQHQRRPPPFIIRRGRLYTFVNLREQHHPFAGFVQDGLTVERSENLWSSADRLLEFKALLNKVLLKICGAKGLVFDREHKRWYFGPGEGNTDRSIEYTPLNKKTSKRKVAWQPTFRATGARKNHWAHLAVRLGFELVGPRSWIFTIRPERYFTRDGRTPFTGAGAGRRATAAAARIYNHDLLEDVNFWRAYLSSNTSKITKKLGANDALVIDTRMLEATVTWPGVPDDERPFKNVEFQDDPSLAELPVDDEDDEAALEAVEVQS